MEAKLSFIFGTMGSSKSAQALMMRFNYIENGMNVLFLKPSIDHRDGVEIVKSRVGIEAKAQIFFPNENLIDKYSDQFSNLKCIIVDESNFLTREQVNQLRNIVDHYHIPVYCYGLRSDFRSDLFEGSKRLFELSDNVSHIEMICHCGRPTIVNTRYVNNEIITEGDVVDLGGNERYQSLCYDCYINKKLKPNQ